MKRFWNMLTGRGRSATCRRPLSLATGVRTTCTRKVRLQVEALEDRCLPAISFAAPVIYAESGSPGGKTPGGVTTADLTGNGIQDLIVANESGSNSVNVFMGNGDGTFQAATLVNVGGNQASVAVADLNHDGKPDIVTSDYNALPSATVNVVLSNGNGTFQSAVKYPLPGTATTASVAVADLTGSGIPDIIVADPATDSVDVLMGNGDGTFQTAVSYALGASLPFGCPDMVVADLTGNGKPDIITSDGSVLLNQGNGTFGPPVSFSSGGGAVGVADFNADGIPDIVTTSPGNNSVSVVLGTGTGSFGAAQSYSTGAGTHPVGVAVANINGRADIVTSDSNTSTASVLVNNGDGTFAAPLTFSVGNSKLPRPVAVADLNGDGKPDIITANNYSVAPIGHQDVSVLLNTSGPSFGVSGFPSSVTAGTTASITVTALNTDGSVNTGYSGTVHFTSSDPKAVLPADSTLTNGTGTFSVTLKTAGTQSITATDSSNHLTGSESSITVNPAAATQFVITGPSSVSAGTSFSITVTAEDAYGNIATGYTGTVHFTNSVGGATLPADYTFTSSDAGVHTFKSLKLKTKGTNVLTVKDTSNASISGSLTVKVT
jgi:hypothetical protein